jgi:HlyD family secretion protein
MEPADTAAPVSFVSPMDRPIPARPRWRRFAPWVGAGIVLLGAVVWTVTSTQDRSYRVLAKQLTLSTVAQRSFDDFIALRGTVAPLVTAYLTTDQGGTVRQVLVEDGAMVKSGQPLIVLSNPALQLQVAAQQLTFEQTRFAYEQQLLDIEHEISKLQAKLVRDKILLDGNAIAPSTYQEEADEYQYRLKMRAALIASRKVEQRVRSTELIGDRWEAGSGSRPDIANAGIEALTIRAPMDGQLTALDAHVGESKAHGAVLGQVNSADRFKLTADIDEYYLGRVVVGQAAVIAANGRTYPARVAKLYPQVANGAFKTDFHLDREVPPSMHVGQTSELRVELGGTRDAIVVANGPFYQTSGGNWVFVVDAEGKEAIRRTVALGRKNPQYVEILDGLKPGETVIVSSYAAYRNIDRIKLEGSDSSRK